MADQVLSALGFLSNNLSTFVNEERKLLGGLRQEVQLMSDEFGHMNAFLQAVDSDKEDDPRLAEWSRQVREAAYDTENVLDEFRLLFPDQRPRGFFGSVSSNFNSLKNFPARNRLATKLQSIKARINHISEARQRYESQYGKIPAQFSQRFLGNSASGYSKDNEALFTKEDQLVGIDKPKKELIAQIIDSGSQLKVIAVLGMGGIGKTTLVKRAHSDAAVESHFRIHTWVTISQTYDLKEILRGLLRRLHAGFKEPAPPSTESMDIDELVAHTKHFLQRERYAIVLDDVWDNNFWDTFKFVLTENSFGGNCVMITTRIANVASSSCIDFDGRVFRMPFLTSQESMTLFCRKTFKDSCCPAHLEDVVEDIVGKCEGLPLAILAISGVLATKSLCKKDQWERIQRRVGGECEGSGKLDRVKKILSLSYNDLSPILKTCLLYTSIFPEDEAIDCWNLIRLWTAERFVERGARRSIEEVGWGYIKELADRSLIQLGEISYDGLPENIHIHDLLREAILSESRKINLTTVIGPAQHPTISWLPENVLRRLVFHGDCILQNFVAQRSHRCFNSLRSIVTFNCKEPPSKALLSELLSSKFLKVVSLKYMELEEIPRQIFRLFHLTHLNLEGTRVKIVPKSVKRLQNLEYLNLTETRVRELPEQILKLRKLRYLLLYRVDPSNWKFGYYGFKAPGNLGSLLELQILGCVDAAESDKTRIVTEIGKLTQLTRLGITNLRREDGKELCSSVEKLFNLRELRVASSIEKDEEGMILDLNHHISASSLQSICFLSLRGRFEKMPPWISNLQNLGQINLIWSSLTDDPLESLQHLPNLIRVYLHHAYQGESLCFKTGGFQKLRKLELKELKVLRRMRVEEGAMPHIKEIILQEIPMLEEVPSGIEHLRELEKLRLWDMSSELRKKLEESEDHKKNIAHIAAVYIDGRWFDRRQLSQENKCSGLIDAAPHGGDALCAKLWMLFLLVLVAVASVLCYLYLSYW